MLTIIENQQKIMNRFNPFVNCLYFLLVTNTMRTKKNFFVFVSQLKWCFITRNVMQCDISKILQEWLSAFEKFS